jgi:hypothetical protein
VSNGSTGGKGTPPTAPGGVAKRRKAPAPQRPFVVAAKSPTPSARPGATGKAAPAASPPAKQAASASPAEPVDGSLLRVTQLALARYVRNAWFAVDAVLVLVLFIFCYRSQFNTVNFFTSAAFLMGILSTIGAYGLAHGVVPPEQYLPLAREHGATRAVGGLALAAIVVRTAYCLIFVGLALAFQRFYGLEAGSLLAAWLGLIVACAFLTTAIVCLSSPIAPRVPRIAALVLLMLGFASYDATGLLGGVLFVARITLFPFIAPYRLAVAPNDVLAWLGTVLLAPAVIVGLILLGGYWLRHGSALASAGSAADAPAQPVAVAR